MRSAEHSRSNGDVKLLHTYDESLISVHMASWMKPWLEEVLAKELSKAIDWKTSRSASSADSRSTGKSAVPQIKVQTGSAENDNCELLYEDDGSNLRVKLHLPKGEQFIVQITSVSTPAHVC